jgi:hypothetical protein
MVNTQTCLDRLRRGYQRPNDWPQGSFEPGARQGGSLGWPGLLQVATQENDSRAAAAAGAHPPNDIPAPIVASTPSAP